MFAGVEASASDEVSKRFGLQAGSYLFCLKYSTYVSAFKTPTLRNQFIYRLLGGAVDDGYLEGDCFLPVEVGLDGNLSMLNFTKAPSMCAEDSSKSEFGVDENRV